jgi:hypothetical protein
MTLRLGITIAAVAGLPLALPMQAAAQAPAGQGMVGQGIDMPDARQMSGMPLNAAELTPGTVTVRVVRGAMTNPLAKQKVEITGDITASGETNDTGRAEFTGLKIGAHVKAVATVDGQRIESQEFHVPETGGMRVALVALDAEMAKRAEEDRKLAAGPAKPGIVVFSDQSRFVFELGDEGLNVFNIFEIENTARTPVNPAVPIVFDLPAAAQSAAMLDGASPLAKVEGRQVVVSSPFPPGKTLVQFAYTLPYSGGAVTFSQKLPAALPQLSVIAQKVGDTSIASEQLRGQQDMHAEGNHYIVGQGPPLAAGSMVTVAFTGLPYVPTWPRNVALGLAALILVGGGVAAFRGRTARGAEAERKRLEAERERLFAQLTALEASQRSGAIDAQTYATRRRTLVTSLEQIYAALDEDVAA